jgi:NitT/TauT family transport system substrate-binding protein
MEPSRRPRIRRPGRLAAWALVASLLVGACGRAGPESGLVEVRIGANLWMGYDLLSMAADLGWFEEEGFNVEIVDLGSLADSKAAFERGYVDGMATTVMEVVQARSESDLNPIAVLVADYSNGTDVVVAKRAITSIAGLAGARIAVDPPLGIYILYRMLATMSTLSGPRRRICRPSPGRDGSTPRSPSPRYRRVS